MIYTQSELRTFIINSNLIEGVIDEREITNTFDAWNKIKDKAEITLDDILDVHGEIMKVLNPDIAGKIREVLRCVGSRICPNPRQVKINIRNWALKYKHGFNRDKDTLEEDVVEYCKQAHIEFERIHPFFDGNGRTGRLLWLWHRQQSGLPFDYINIKDRAEYYQWFYTSVEKERIEKNKIKELIETAKIIRDTRDSQDEVYSIQEELFKKDKYNREAKEHYEREVKREYEREIRDQLLEKDK